MKRFILIHMILLFITSCINLNAQWAKTYGGSNQDSAHSIQQTLDGGYIVAGSTSSFDAEYGNDIWVLKLFFNGDIEWQRTYGGSGKDVATSIQQTLDGGYIVAGSTSSFGAEYGDDIWVLKLLSNGDIEWQRKFGKGGGHDWADSIQQTFDGGYIIAGTTESFSSALFPDRFDMLIIKLTSGGDIEWQRLYGGSGGDGDCSLKQTKDGGYIVAGFTRKQGWLNTDIWVIKLTLGGDIEWQRLYGGTRCDGVCSITQSGEAGYIIAGYTESFDVGDIDFWILKLDLIGNVEWEYTYGGEELDRAHFIQQTDDGGYIVAGGAESFTFPSLPHQTDMLILKLASDGSIAPACDFIGSSNAVISDTYISPQDTDIIPQDTYISYQDTNIIPQITRAIVMTLCVKYNLTISYAYGGTANPSPGLYSCYSGTEVQIEANPWSGFEFSHWSGDASGSNNPIIIIMDSDKSITANFNELNEERDDGPIEFPCVIATAAYGSPLHPYVESLCDFRDKYLMESKLGRTIVGLYYEYSPFFANLITKYKTLKILVRINLIPLIIFSYSMVHFGPLITGTIILFIFVCSIFLTSSFRKT